jgi:cob(I)alamin adenosyltransferase
MPEISERYLDELEELARKLAREAGAARSRGIYGLEDALTAAAESARSWARALRDHEAGERRNG